jgi:hypothetical protein
MLDGNGILLNDKALQQQAQNLLFYLGCWILQGLLRLFTKGGEVRHDLRLVLASSCGCAKIR